MGKSALEQSIESDQEELEKLINPEEETEQEEENLEEEEQVEEEDQNTDDEDEENSEDEEEASKEDEEASEEEEEEKPSKPAKKEEKATDNAAMARMRVEANKAKQKALEAETRAEKAEAIIAQMKAGKTEDGDLDDVETDVEKQELSPELQEVVFQQKISKATQDFQALEDNWHDKPDDYDAMGIAYRGALFNAYKVQNPSASNDQIMQQVKVDLLTKAGNYVKAGVDPCEALYDEAKALGLEPYYPDQEEQEEEREEAPKPKKKAPLKTIAKNKKRSAGMAGTKGASNQVNLTASVAADMSLAEFAKLSPEELVALERGEE